MKAVRLHGRGGPEQLVYEEAPQPQPGPGEVLARVGASGVIANELKWDETYQTVDGAPRPLPIPGHDLSGEVAAVGPGVTDLTMGDAVYALIAFRRDGADADYVIALPSELAPRPRTLDDTQAAAVPLSALTAWQALFVHGGLSAGQTALIHGAAGGVGVFATQLARWKGARVITTASARNADFVRALGADEVIDYATTRFDEVVHDADVVFDAVGGDTLARSWRVVKPGGALVSVVSPLSGQPVRDDIRYIYFIVEPSGAQLREIGALIDAGQMHPIVDRVFPLAQARQAYEAAATGHPRGKIVITVP
ncbi:MAG TPA: NADP-dependent oxidoreductase [Ktedonobacterales bacterium]|nr:NADP-dependent oxidoreductase [Ktedonobacterales bacterium]